jgi:hypothetical protein
MKNTEDALTQKPVKVDELPSSTFYIGAAGFEDRALALLNIFEKSKRRFQHCEAIEYEPYNPRNRRSAFDQKAGDLFESVSWETYHRFQPEAFADALRRTRERSLMSSQVLLDVSAMSKMLIVVMLEGLRSLDCPLSIVYSAAEIYHPTKSEYEKRTLVPPEPPIFVTTDVFRVVTTHALSSIAMQGAPILMIAFPNFNYLELMALLNEINPHQLILIENSTTSIEDNWKLEAIRKINRGVETYLEPKRFLTDPLNLEANLSILDEIYNEYCYTHKVALAPTGGKLQAVAAFFFKVMHPDIHIVYPAVRDFAKDYTDRYLDPSQVYFPSFQKFVAQLDKHRIENLLEIGRSMKNL